MSTTEAATSERVDRQNCSFYNRYQFPPQPAAFSRAGDPDLERRALLQTLGDWRAERLPLRPRIWVAGCGRFEAISTALAFPDAEVVASDLAERSLAAAEQVAEELGVTNLALRQESLLTAGYRERFDLVISIGVVHHLADPAEGVACLARALRPGGLLELMVYNRFHRLGAAAYQQAIRRLTAAPPEPGEDDPSEARLRIATRLLDEYPVDDRLGRFVAERGSRELLADTFLQPVEHSFTVGELAAMTRHCGLELLHPERTVWDATAGTDLWNLEPTDRELTDRYLGLDDVSRWEVAQLVLGDRSPMLWFYLGRGEGQSPRPDERTLCDEFLGMPFARTATTRTGWSLTAEGRYRRSGSSHPFPPPPPDPLLRRIVEAADGTATAGELLTAAGAPTRFPAVNRLRRALTSRRSPLLLASPKPRPAARPDVGRRLGSTQAAGGVGGSRTGGRARWLSGRSAPWASPVGWGPWPPPSSCAPSTG